MHQRASLQASTHRMKRAERPRKPRGLASATRPRLRVSLTAATGADLEGVYIATR